MLYDVHKIINMRWVVIVLVVFSFLFATNNKAEAKYAAIVLNADTGEIYHQENIDTMNFPASLTKMMTLYLLFEALENNKIQLNSTMQVSRHASNASPTKLGLISGNTITVEEAILALAIKSANDVAVVAAEFLGGTERNFARDIMTNKARELGMENTYFKNASGLPNRGQLSTARDMSILSIALLTDFPQYFHYFSKREFTYNGNVYKTHNKLLLSYPGTTGLKTGYIRSSGFNIAVSVERNDIRMIAVLFGGKTSKWRNNHISRLMNNAWEQIEIANHIPVPKTKPNKQLLAVISNNNE